MFLQDYIHQKKSSFVTFCTDNHVRTLYGFGSGIRSDFNSEKSDVDLLVEIDEPDPVKRGEYLMNFWDKMEDFFKRKVDLLTPTSIRNPILKASIEKSKVLLYER